MERLLADAEKLSGVKYNIDNLGDVYDAIHVIQEDLGLTGVAAAEASETFSGSFAAMKASTQNLLGAIALGQGVGPAMQQLSKSVSTFFFGNFIPMLGRIIKSLPPAVVAFAKAGIPQLIAGLGGMMSTLAASIKNSADGLTSQKVSAWAKATIPKLITAAGTLIKKFASGLIKYMPVIVVSIGRIGAAIVRGLGSALYGKVSAAAKAIKDKFMAPINKIKDKVKTAFDKVKSIFPISIGKVLSNIKTPHFKLKWNSKDFGKLGSIKYPTGLGVEWYKKGGIVTDTTVFNGIGLGEAGSEAIVPLTPFWKKLDEYNTVREQRPIVININGAQDPRRVAEEVKHILIKETNNRRLAWA